MSLKNSWAERSVSVRLRPAALMKQETEEYEKFTEFVLGEAGRLNQKFPVAPKGEPYGMYCNLADAIWQVINQGHPSDVALVGARKMIDRNYLNVEELQDLWLKSGGKIDDFKSFQTLVSIERL